MSLIVLDEKLFWKLFPVSFRSVLAVHHCSTGSVDCSIIFFPSGFFRIRLYLNNIFWSQKLERNELCGWTGVVKITHLDYQISAINCSAIKSEPQRRTKVWLIWLVTLLRLVASHRMALQLMTKWPEAKYFTVSWLISYWSWN